MKFIVAAYGGKLILALKNDDGVIDKNSALSVTPPTALRIAAAILNALDEVEGVVPDDL